MREGLSSTSHCTVEYALGMRVDACALGDAFWW